MVFNMILKDMAGPGTPEQKAALRGTQCPVGITAVPGLVKEMQLVRRQHMITVSPI